ncbi:MAG: hypothetical protein ACM31C_31560 [Acidobacteriota bacterium]
MIASTTAPPPPIASSEDPPVIVAAVVLSASDSVPALSDLMVDMEHLRSMEVQEAFRDVRARITQGTCRRRRLHRISSEGEELMRPLKFARIALRCPALALAGPSPGRASSKQDHQNRRT